MDHKILSSSFQFALQYSGLKAASCTDCKQRENLVETPYLLAILRVRLPTEGWEPVSKLACSAPLLAAGG